MSTFQSKWARLCLCLCLHVSTCFLYCTTVDGYQARKRAGIAPFQVLAVK